jgi:signal transduction histidine kinase
MRERRWPAVAGGVSGGLTALVAVFATWDVAPYPMWVWLPVQLAGASFALCGAALWWRRPGNGTGRLMVLVGLSWFVGDLQLSSRPGLFAVGFCLYYLSSTALGHLVLALPTGRLSHRYERRVIALSYLVLLVEVPRYFAEYPPQPQGWRAPDAPRSVLAPIGSVIFLVLTLLTVALVVRRWRAAGRPVRREYALVWMTIVGIGVVGVVHPVAVLLRASPEVRQYLLLAHALGLVVMPVTIAIGLLRVQLVRLRVADLVVRLERAAEPDQVRAAIAHALDDPDLEVWFPVPDAGAFVRTDGRAGTPPADSRAVTVVERGGAPLAVVVHDPVLHERGPLVESVVAAAGLALDNARLAAAQRALEADARAAHARVVMCADAERRRIQRDLHDGVQHKLLATGMLVERVRRHVDHPAPAGQLAVAAGQLREAIWDLRALAEGIHPPVLAEQGLAAAVEALAEWAPLPVLVDAPPRRWPEHLERAGYYLVAEALSNVYKHAGAGQARVLIGGDEVSLVISVVDDGVGGAEFGRGTGLRGLDDRVRALGGRLCVDSPPGSGTRLVAELPCES